MMELRVLIPLLLLITWVTQVHTRPCSSYCRQKTFSKNFIDSWCSSDIAVNATIDVSLKQDFVRHYALLNILEATVPLGKIPSSELMLEVPTNKCEVQLTEGESYLILGNLVTTKAGRHILKSNSCRKVFTFNSFHAHRFKLRYHMLQPRKNLCQHPPLNPPYGVNAFS